MEGVSLEMGQYLIAPRNLNLISSFIIHIMELEVLWLTSDGVENCAMLAVLSCNIRSAGILYIKVLNIVLY